MSDHEEHSLAKAINALREWLAARCDLATLKDLQGTEARLSALIKNAGSRPPRVRFHWAVGLVQTKPSKENNMPLEIKITNEQQIKVTLTPKTDTGKPAKLDGKPTWEIVSGNSTATVSDDGLSAVLVSSDDPGDTEFLVKADADLGDGVEEISDVVKLSVVGATAKNLGLTAGTPEAKPTA